MALWASAIYLVMLAKDAWHSHKLHQIGRQFTYTLPNGVVYYMDGSIARRLDNDRRLYWQRGYEWNNEDPNVRVVYWDDFNTVVYDAQQWKESQIDRSSFTRFRMKENLRTYSDYSMIYDEQNHWFIAMVKKIYIEETNQYFYKAYRFYDFNWEAYLKRGGNPNTDPHLMVRISADTTDYEDHGYIIEKKYLDEFLPLVEEVGMFQCKKSTEVYSTVDEYKKWEWKWRSRESKIIPQNAELVERI